MTNEFSWTRSNPKAAIWNVGKVREGERIDSYGRFTSAVAEPLSFSGNGDLPEAALTVHSGGKGPEDIDHLAVGAVSYVHESNCIVLSIPSPTA